MHAGDLLLLLRGGGLLQISHAGAEFFGSHAQLRGQRVGSQLNARIYLLQPLIGFRQNRSLFLLQFRHLHAQVSDHYRRGHHVHRRQSIDQFADSVRPIGGGAIGAAVIFHFYTLSRFAGVGQVIVVHSFTAVNWYKTYPLGTLVTASPDCSAASYSTDLGFGPYLGCALLRIGKQHS